MTDNKPEIVEEVYRCTAPACEDETGGDFDMCARHTAQYFWNEMRTMRPEIQSRIIAELRELMALQRALPGRSRR